MNKIYCFLNTVNNESGVAYAISDTGLVLGTHCCSEDAYVPHDLGVDEGARPDRLETYAKYFPNGYEMEFIPNDRVENHRGLQEAIKKNQEMCCKNGD